MTETLLYEFSMPVDGYGKITYRVVNNGHFNILQIIWGEYVTPIPLIGYSANFFFEMGGRLASKYASLSELMPHLPPIELSPQPVYPQQNFSFGRTSFGNSSPNPSNPKSFPKNKKKTDPLKIISIDEAVAILKGKQNIPDRYVKVAITEETMADFIVKYKGGSELYINGEYETFKEAKLFINFDLFRNTTLQLCTDKKITKYTKISQKHKKSYDVYRIPKELPVIALEQTPPEKITAPVSETVPTPANTINLAKMTDQPKDEDLAPQSYDISPKVSERSSAPDFEQPTLVPASAAKSSITNYLETLFYSYQDAELDLQIFLSDAQYQKIPPEVARDFYIKKLEERDKRLLRLNKRNNDDLHT